MGWKEIALYGVKGNQRAGGTAKHTEYVKDGSGDRGTTFKYSDGCITVYQHQGGRVSGYHAKSNGDVLQRFDRAEGGAESKHPHHPEGQQKAVRVGKQADFLGELAVAWDRALRWNGMRRR